MFLVKIKSYFSELAQLSPQLAFSRIPPQIVNVCFFPHFSLQSVKTLFVQMAKLKLCLSKAGRNLETNNQISNVATTEYAARAVGGGTRVLLPSSAESKLSGVAE